MTRKDHIRELAEDYAQSVYRLEKWVYRKKVDIIKLRSIYDDYDAGKITHKEVQQYVKSLPIGELDQNKLQDSILGFTPEDYKGIPLTNVGWA